MIKNFIYIILCFASLVILTSQESIKIVDPTNAIGDNDINNDFNDGPYIMLDRDSIIELNVVNGIRKIKRFGLNTRKTKFKDESSTYTNVSSIAALSDLHGQYDLAIKILINNSIIDKNLNWTFGTGHLVIVGDIFDRGAKVTELLWFVHNLEQQAQKNGGKVHFTLGNHEHMVMQNDLRYINKKYRFTERLLETSYDKLYDEQSLLGRWLRSKNTIVKIDSYLFVHGGISNEFIEQGFSLEETNQAIRQSLYEDEVEVKWDSLYNKYYNSKGPIWYRGYFSDSFKKRDINKLLRKLDVRHIIVGHTSQQKIESLFRNKVFAVDSSIKNNVYGEILFIENGVFYRGTMNGQKIRLEQRRFKQK